MNREIYDLIKRIEQERGRKEPPATPEDILSVTDYLRIEFDLPLPRIWSDIWSLSDGILWNGVRFYRAGPGREATKGFIDSLVAVNEVYKDNTRGDYVFYGHADDVAAYVYHIPSRTWQDVDPIGLEAFETYQTPEEMIITVLTKYLEM